MHKEEIKKELDYLSNKDKMDIVNHIFKQKRANNAITWQWKWTN